MIKKVLLGLIIIAYPAIVYFGLQYFEPSLVAGVFAVLFLIRHFCQKDSVSVMPNPTAMLVVVLGLLIFSAVANSALALKFYPVVINLSFLVIFGYSLYKPPTVVEVIARLKEQLDQDGIAYTRNVTKVWCGFFITNASIALWTIFQTNEQIWLIYNGLISYLLMACLMVAEFIVRRRHQSKKTIAKIKAKANSDEVSPH